MKIKRIFAIIAVVLLVALYGSTIVFAMSDNPNAVYMFKASIFCTVIIPIIFGKKESDHTDDAKDIPKK